MPDTATRILVVDDRRDQLITLRAILGDVVDEIVCATSGREALRLLLDATEFAVMLLDIEMPGMDGFVLAEMVRKHRVHRQTPIIFVTASSDDLHVQRCYALGAVDYILSPIVPSVLRTKVAVLVDLHRKTQQVRLQAEVLRRRAAQLHSLTSVSVAIHAAGSVPDILRAAADAAKNIVGGEAVAATAAPAGDQAPPHAVVAGRPAGTSPTSLLRELSRLEAAVRQRGATLRLTKEERSRTAEWASVPGEEGARAASYVGAPLAWSDGHTIGVLQVSGKGGGENFDADDEAVIAQLAHVTSVALQNRVLGDAREANRLKDEFFTNLSHELRNPLNAVVGWLQLLRRGGAGGGGAADEAARERALAALERNTQLLTRLVDDLLDASRVVGKRLPIATKPMALDEVVRSTVESLRMTAEAKGIRLECRFDDRPLDVLGDWERLTQVTWNLVANALKFTARDGSVTVRLLREGADAVLIVEDDGEGIAPDFLPHVFERFQQAAGSTRPTGGGLGLGLSIVRAVVELHGGTVRAESAGLGCGSRFTVRLPLLPTTLALDGYHVLLVEPDTQVRTSMERGFVSLGARVTAVAEPAQARRALGATRPHVLVVLEGHLKGETLTALPWTTHPDGVLPVLALTESGEEVGEAGAGDDVGRMSGVAVAGGAAGMTGGGPEVDVVRLWAEHEAGGCLRPGEAGGGGLRANQANQGKAAGAWRLSGRDVHGPRGAATWAMARAIRSMVPEPS